MTSYLLAADSAAPDQKFAVDLNDETFIFRVKYNTRAEKWFLSMSDEEEVAIFSGAPMALGINYFDLYTDERIPAGALYCFNFESVRSEPTRDNLGLDAFLIYDDLV